MKVLLTCEGTSDPIRGYHDGPVLHILRKYRPEVVVVFASTEIQELNQWDNRHAKIRALMKNSWGYEPEWCVEPLNLIDVQDLDLVYEVLGPALKKYLRKYGQEELLINVTSGTPQMQFLMIDLAKDVRYNCRAIQVSNPDKASGQGGRTNDTRFYLVDEQILGNRDERPDYEDRCAAVTMVSVERKNKWEQLRGILELRDFETAAKMNMLPIGASRMLEHLLQRSRLNTKEAYAQARSLLLTEQMFPIRFVSEDRRTERLCEYYLILRNMQKSGRITEFILRLNPFVVTLQTALIERLLPGKYEVNLSDLIDTSVLNRRTVSTEKMKQHAPVLYQEVNQNLGQPMRDADMSIVLANAFLKSLDAPDNSIKLFADCEKLNAMLRNLAAHDLKHFTERDIKGCLRYNSNELLRQIEDLIPTVFPRYPEESFREYFKVYDVGIEYILKQK